MIGNIEWVPIIGFPNYEIRIDGIVRNKKTGKIKKPSLGHNGYPVYSLRDSKGKLHLKTVHRLLAIAFIPNPERKAEINHIDGNKENYSINNLEWCTRKENDNHARKTGLHKSDGDKEVAQYSKSGELISVYKSASYASRITGIGRSNICNVACHRGYCKTAGGYIWKWTK